MLTGIILSETAMTIYWALPSRWARLHKTVLKSVRGLLTFVLEQQPFVLK